MANNTDGPKHDRLSILVDLDHPLVRLERALDWDKLLEFVDQIRRSKVKSAAGRPPCLRVLVAAILLKAFFMRQTYRDEADLIRHFAPARYLCALTHSDWSPAKSTIWDFMNLLGENGQKAINQYVVAMAARKGLTDPNHLVADTTAQEAAIPYPNEMGLMSSFLKRVRQASQTLGGVFKSVVDKAHSAFEKAKIMVRHYRLFAKTKEHKDLLMTKMAAIADRVQHQLGSALAATRDHKQPLVKYQKVALRNVTRLHEVIKQLLPQIRSWLKTGRVARHKIVSLTIPQTYAIVRGKVGKAVEFGLLWGIARLRGGYLLATCAKDKRELADKRFAIRAVDDHIKLFGKAPQSFAYDRGAHCAETIRQIKARRVQQIGIAPKGKAPWLVQGKVKQRLIKERALVEGGIGTIKSTRYGFNRPAARSSKMMGACGQSAVLGFNLNRLVQDLARRSSPRTRPARRRGARREARPK